MAAVSFFGQDRPMYSVVGTLIHSPHVHRTLRRRFCR